MPTKIDKKNTILSHAVGMSIMIAFLLPHNTSSLLLLVNPIIVIIFKLFKQNRNIYKNSLIIIVSLLITLIINIPQDISFKSIQRGAAIILYFICFPFVGSVKVPQTYLYVTFSFILISQYYTLLDIPLLTNFINTYYPMSEFSEGTLTYIDEHVNTENFTSYRHAGIFRNSNACAEALSMLLAFFIINKSEEKAIIKNAIAIAIYYAIFITGSRSGFIVSSLLILINLLINNEHSNLTRTISVIIIIIVTLLFFGVNSGNYRALEIQEGLSSSLNTKLLTFKSYLYNEDSLIKLTLGYWDSSIYANIAETGVMKTFDSDYGSIIFSYGFIGFIAIIFFIYSVFRDVRGIEKTYFLLILWMFSATIFKSYRMIFIFMLLLSIIYSNSINRKDITTNNSTK